MNTDTEVLLASGTSEALLSTASKPAEILSYAVQLAQRDRLQISNAFSTGSYAMATHFVWSKTLSVLKNHLATVDLRLLEEMLGRGELGDAGSSYLAISDEEAITLAEELGVVSGTEAMRLRKVHETLSHFLRMDGSAFDSDGQAMAEREAIQALKCCVKNLLGKEKIAVSTGLAKLRHDLEIEVFKDKQPGMRNLAAGPYFLRKISVGMLMAAAGKSHGEKLENVLANLNIVLPLIWIGIKEPERWLVGRSYAEACNSGGATAAGGIVRALIRVAGLDYIPENLRSSAYVKVAAKLIGAHEAPGNFYTELSPIKEMQSMGTTIPMAAFSHCATALLSVYMGNLYGVSNAAHSISTSLLRCFPENRWEYYFNECLSSDVRVLNKLAYEKPRSRFFTLVDDYNVAALKLNASAKKLLEAALAKDVKRTLAVVDGMKKKYYGDRL